MAEDKIISNKMIILGKLTARLTHELRNPLSAIKLNLDYLKMFSEELPGHANDTIDSTIEAFERVHYLIENILDFSRQSYQSDNDCDINEISRRAIGILKGIPGPGECKIVTDFDENIPSLNFNNNELLQVFLNLMTNAVEACDGKCLIEIKSYLNEDGDIVWSIADSGIGIEEEDKLKIFEDFFTKKTNGTGLGLGVCKRILESKDAELTFESSNGNGTAFYITFKSEKN
jgi:two-component system, NtrC family, sensor kinase